MALGFSREPQALSTMEFTRDRVIVISGSGVNS